MSFENNIKDWVSIDDEIKKYNEHIRKLREKRNELTENVYTHVNTQNLGNATVNISDGKLKFQSVKVTQPVSIKLVKKCLNECINDEDLVDTIIEHIKNNREVKYVDDIKRYYDKK